MHFVQGKDLIQLAVRGNLSAEVLADTSQVGRAVATCNIWRFGRWHPRRPEITPYVWTTRPGSASSSVVAPAFVLKF